nr:G protein-coupled receptor [Proales similis]
MDGDGFIEKLTKFYGYSYINPGMCFFGIFCNLINLSVLLSKGLKESPYTYLTGLATCDILTLLFTISTSVTRGVWIKYFRSFEFILVRLERLFFLPSANVFSATSIFITVALTIERYLFIRFPMHAASYCTARNARIIITILFICIVTFRTPMYLFSDAIRLAVNQTQSDNYSKLDPAQEYRVVVVMKFEEWHKFYFTLSFILFEIIPFLVLSILNLNLVMMVRNSNKELALLSETGRASLSHGDQSEANKRSRSNFRFVSFKRLSTNQYSVASQLRTVSSRRKRDQLRLTRTLIAVVCLVLLSEISSIVTYDKVTYFLIGQHRPSYMKNGYKFQVFLSNLIVLFVHSVNFFLYCVFNTKYLNILKQKYKFCFAMFNR